jgi:protein-disulfide isomerase
VQQLTVWVLVAMTLAYPTAGLAQDATEIQALTKEVEALKSGQAALQRELQEIKAQLLQRRQPGSAAPLPPRREVVLNIDSQPFKGDRNAKLTLVEFTDYQCPFCGRYVRQTLPQIDKDYVQSGKVRYVLLDFPLESIHPQALKAAEAARCAGEQAKYWEMHDRLFADQQALGLKDLSEHAQALGLDSSKFQQCLDGGTYAAKIRANQAEGQRAGVRGTPAFFLGLSDPADPAKVKVMRMISGAQSYPAFQAALDDLVSQ